MVSLDFAPDGGEQAGFNGSVSRHDAAALPCVQGEVHAGEQALRTAAQGKLGEAEDGTCLLPADRHRDHQRDRGGHQQLRHQGQDEA